MIKLQDFRKASWPEGEKGGTCKAVGVKPMGDKIMDNVPKEIDKVRSLIERMSRSNCILVVISTRILTR